MSKVFMVVFLIFGTVVGSGFSSGKEIMVYFSRFGKLSYLYIALSAILFFAVFYFFLRCGKAVIKVLEKSKFINFLVATISFVFCASMFAGTRNLLSYFPLLWDVALTVLLIGLCIWLSLCGIRGLQKFNLYLMPTVTVLFLIVLFFCMANGSGVHMQVKPLAGLLYSPLYVALNTSMSGLVIARVGEGLSKKQTVFACLLTTLLLLVFLFLGNSVLLNNADSFSSVMPFLFLAKQNFAVFVLCFIVIFVGCITTLLSLCFTLKTAFDAVIKNKLVCAATACLLPFFFSFFGFSAIVSLLYPICSVLGILILFYLIFKCITKLKVE